MEGFDFFYRSGISVFNIPGRKVMLFSPKTNCLHAVSATHPKLTIAIIERSKKLFDKYFNSFENNQEFKVQVVHAPTLRFTIRAMVIHQIGEGGNRMIRFKSGHKQLPHDMKFILN